jgi:hypothetical protein
VGFQGQREQRVQRQGASSEAKGLGDIKQSNVRILGPSIFVGFYKMRIIQILDRNKLLSKKCFRQGFSGFTLTSTYCPGKALKPLALPP